MRAKSPISKSILIAVPAILLIVVISLIIGARSKENTLTDSLGTNPNFPKTAAFETTKLPKQGAGLPKQSPSAQNHNTDIWGNLSGAEFRLKLTTLDNIIERDKEGSTIAGTAYIQELGKEFSLLGIRQGHRYSLDLVADGGEVSAQIFGELEDGILYVEFRPEYLEKSYMVELHKQKSEATAEDYTMNRANINGRYISKRTEYIEDSISNFSRELNFSTLPDNGLQIKYASTTKMDTQSRSFDGAAELSLNNNTALFYVGKNNECGIEVHFYDRFVVLTYPEFEPCMDEIFDRGVIGGAYIKIE